MTIPRATDFNSIVMLDLKEKDKKYIIWIVFEFTRLMIGVIVKNKKAETILKRLELEWCMKFGNPSVGFYVDNGGEFSNYKMEEFVSKLGMKIEFSPSYSP